MTAHTEDMVLVPRAEWDALRAENRRLRREAGDREALRRIRSDSGEGRTFTREELAEAWALVSDRVLEAMDAMDALDAVGKRNVELVGQVKPGQWDDPTPCAEWSVRTLVGHLITGRYVYRGFLEGV